MKLITLTQCNGYDRVGEITINSERIISLKSEFGRMKYTTITLAEAKEPIFVSETPEQIRAVIEGSSK